MFRTELATQTKVSARGYIEVRSKIWNAVPLALMIGMVFPLAYDRAMQIMGGLLFEFIDYWHKVFFYDAGSGRHAKPRPKRYRARREAGVRKLREVGYVLSLGIRSTRGSHRLAA